MSSSSPDRNALLGLLAVRIELLTPEALAEAVHAWERDPREPLGPFLVARRLLEGDELELLEALVERCLRRQAQGAVPAGTLRTSGGAVSATLTPDEAPASGGRPSPVP